MDFKNAKVIIHEGTKKMQMPDGTIWTMDQFLDETKKRGISIFALDNQQETEYFNNLTVEEQDEYLKTHAGYKGGSYVVFQKGD